MGVCTCNIFNRELRFKGHLVGSFQFKKDCLDSPDSPVINIIIKSVQKTNPECKCFIICEGGNDTGFENCRPERYVVTFSEKGEPEVTLCRQPEEAEKILQEAMAQYGQHKVGITEEDFDAAKDAVRVRLAIPEQRRAISNKINALLLKDAELEAEQSGYLIANS